MIDRIQISIVVPARNEAKLIRDFLQHLRQRALGAEIIVVDGQSSDETAQFADGRCDQLLVTSPNRAVQMNAGARAAHGNVLWFLHVDAEIPPNSPNEIANALNDPRVVGGFFRIRLPRKDFVYRFTDVFAHYAGLLLGMRYGDHGIFCRRDVFEKCEGFPEVALMEDVGFFRKLRRCGRIRTIPARITVNPRRYEQIGPTRLTLAYGWISLLYFFGASPNFLHRVYQRLCCRTER